MLAAGMGDEDVPRREGQRGGQRQDDNQREDEQSRETHRSSGRAPIWPPSLFKPRGLSPPPTPPAIPPTPPRPALAPPRLCPGWPIRPCTVSSQRARRTNRPKPPSLPPVR